MNAQQSVQILPLPTFLAEVKKRIGAIFTAHPTDPNAPSRGMTAEVLHPILDTQPLSVFIPERFGGRGQQVHECLALLETCSYESLPLSLAMGINGALFLQPVSKYAPEDVQAAVFRRFLNHNALGGLMITEPDFGSDALQMRTRFTATPDGYRLQGTKHWAGLTGQADYWLLTARGQTQQGELERAISFFIWDKSHGGVDVQEYYDSLGLYKIPYGLNRIDTVVPTTHRLQAAGGGVRMLLDLLHRSRLQFPGMAMGFLRRLLDEAIAHTRSRFVGGRPLAEYDQVQNRLAELQSSFTVCSAMCAYTSGIAGVENDCSGAALSANSIKTYITDLMQAGAQSLLQLVGAKGYRLSHIAGSAVVDSRPFQIFEGSNDILYQQISEAILKAMARVKESNLLSYLRSFERTSRAAELLKEALNFSVDLSEPQRKLVDLGRALSRIMSLQMVLEIGDRGFRADLIANAVAVVKRDVTALLQTCADVAATRVVENYDEKGSWLATI